MFQPVQCGLYKTFSWWKDRQQIDVLIWRKLYKKSRQAAEIVSFVCSSASDRTTQARRHHCDDIVVVDLYKKRKKWGSMSSWNLDFVYIPILNHYIRSKYLDSNSHTCWTSAVVDRKSSMYLDPMFSLCFRSAFSASSSSANNTKASPVARPSGFLTNKIPSSPSTNEHVCSPREKNSI